MATFTVTNLFDSGVGSLRNAIFQANTASTTDMIDFNPSLSGGTINLTSGELGISDNLTINGSGADLLRVDAGGNPFRVFNVDDGNNSTFLEVAIKGLTITGGNADNGGGILNSENLTLANSTLSGNTADADGGGIANSGVLAVNNSTISDNTAVEDQGGSIANSGVLTVTNSTLSGNAAGFSGGGIFNVRGDVTVTNSTLSGNTAYGGGGIENVYGDVTVTNSTLSGNTAVEDEGGGIANYFGDLTVSNSTISGNTSSFFGGGIDVYGGLVTVTNSTISGNTSEVVGGGIANSGLLTVANSTISGNTSAFDGGGINNFGTLTVTNSTISGNTAEEGGGINNSDVLTVTSSIIADNTNNKDIEGDDFTSGGNNLIGNGDGTTGFTNGVNGDLVGTASNPIDPLLGELQNNGGPTQTQALLPGSPAIDAGSNPLNLEFDQRGPGFDRVVGTQTDIGAYEVVPEPDSTLGVLGVAILGVVLVRKCQRLKKTKA